MFYLYSPGCLRGRYDGPTSRACVFVSAARNTASMNAKLVAAGMTVINLACAFGTLRCPVHDQLAVMLEGMKPRTFQLSTLKRSDVHNGLYGQLMDSHHGILVI